MEASGQRGRHRGSKREKSADFAQRAVAIPAHDRSVEIERVECGSEQADLMLAHLPQQSRCEPMLLEEVEDRDGAVMAGGIVGRAREPVAPRSVGHPLTALSVL